MRTYFVKEVITSLHEPKVCPRCIKEDRLEKNLIKEKISGGKTYLCTRCEALTVVTNLNLSRVDLDGSAGSNVMLKEPHLIRKIR